MRCVAVIVFIGLCGLIHGRPEEKYTTKFDNIDLEPIFKNDRLLRNYIDCLLDKRPCTKDGEELKKYLPEAIKTKCAKCSDVQKEKSKEMMLFLIKEKRPWWNELRAKYDPENFYVTAYADDIKKAGIEL